jgi:hypothetical protein
MGRDCTRSAFSYLSLLHGILAISIKIKDNVYY